MFKSLKVRIALGAFAILAALLSFVGGSAYAWTKHRLREQLRKQALTMAQGAAAQATVDHGFLEVYHSNIDHYRDSNASALLQILNRNGVVLYGPGEAWPDFAYEPTLQQPQQWSEREWKGKPTLALKYSFSALHEHGGLPAQPYHAAVIIAIDRSAVNQTLTDLARGLALIIALGSVIGAGLLSLLAYISIRPLDQLAHNIDKIDHLTPDPIPPIQGLPSESEPVYRELNSLIERVSQEMLRERQFTANVSHELRTPLTGLHTTLEVALKRNQTDEEHRESSQVCLNIVLQAERLMEQLLRFRRLESGQQSAESEPAELNECLDAVWQNFARRAEERQLQVHWNNRQEIPLHLPLDLFIVVLNNLIENAVNYATEGGQLLIESIPGADKWTLAISNSQTGMSEEMLPRMFEPFWRADESRTETGVHAGLGLAITRSMAKICNLQLRPKLDGSVYTIEVSGQHPQSL